MKRSRPELSIDMVTDTDIFKNNEVSIHTLPHIKRSRLVSMRSNHLPFKMYQVGFRAFKFPLYLHRRANRTDQKYQN